MVRGYEVFGIKDQFKAPTNLYKLYYFRMCLQGQPADMVSFSWTKPGLFQASSGQNVFLN